MPLHDSNEPRHLRIFELLRQSDAAVDCAMSGQKLKSRPLSGAEIDALKTVALRSFRRADETEA